MWDPRNLKDTDFGLAGGVMFEPEDADARDDIDLSQPHIMTVLGAIHPDELGVCQHHEHILSDPVALTRDDPGFRLDRIDLASEELESFFTSGGRAMVDASTPDYGRDLNGLRTIAQRVPIHIIAVAGRHQHLHSSRMTNALDRDKLAKEIQSDIDGKVRPGLITFGTSLDEITPVEEVAARAAATVAVATGYPVSTHAEAGTMAHEQLDLMESEGLEPGRVIVGHLDRRLDMPALPYLLSVARRGAWISFDQVGKARHGPDALKAETLVALAEAGYGDQLLVSQGLSRTSDLVAYGGKPGWIHLLERFAIDLMAADAGAPLVRQLLIDNPSRALSIVPR
ncbi:MAG: hypothetical protein M3457_01630 [Chloroflexota bacterium]|nr:hypothetical protein [Chloroflexota bacterium]